MKKDRALLKIHPEDAGWEKLGAVIREVFNPDRRKTSTIIPNPKSKVKTEYYCQSAKRMPLLRRVRHDDVGPALL